MAHLNYQYHTNNKVLLNIRALEIQDGNNHFSDDQRFLAVKRWFDEKIKTHGTECDKGEKESFVQRAQYHS
jgi:hypothetical protein